MMTLPDPWVALDSQIEFGNRLRKAREKAGFTQIELAKLSGYTNGWISSVECGSGLPTATFARRMEIILRADLKFGEVKAETPRRAVRAGTMTVVEVASYVGLSRTRVYELTRRADTEGNRALPCESQGGFRRIPVDGLAAWMVQDYIVRGEVSKEDRESKTAELIADIEEWLKTRRAYAQEHAALRARKRNAGVGTSVRETEPTPELEPDQIEALQELDGVIEE